MIIQIPTNLPETVRTFKALAEPNRIRIVKMLEIGPMCVCEITHVLEIAVSTVSKHLSILRSADLIHEQKEGKWVNYYLNISSDSQLARPILNQLAGLLPDDDTIRQDAEKARQVDRNQICRG